MPCRINHVLQQGVVPELRWLLPLCWLVRGIGQPEGQLRQAPFRGHRMVCIIAVDAGRPHIRALDTLLPHLYSGANC